MTVNLEQIEKLTRDYADARAALAELVAALQARLEELKRPALPQIRTAVRRTADQHAALHAALEQSPDLFSKPKTRTFSGVRVGYRKQPGRVEMDDEEAVIARIRKKLPDDQAELLIRRRESVYKQAVYDLSAADLKRLGISLSDDEDVVVIKAVDDEVDRLVSALLAEAEKAEQEAAA
ncbi:MAG: host-nuclease inhibitor Gam family protein [Pseudomonadales bacterium]|nr:host-nuclease inhibitor Gam family protein [Pseudomonadales bacterium]